MNATKLSRRYGEEIVNNCWRDLLHSIKLENPYLYEWLTSHDISLATITSANCPVNVLQELENLCENAMNEKNRNSKVNILKQLKSSVS